VTHGIGLALVLALSAAGLHALWNVMLKTSADPLRVSAAAIGSGMLVATPVAALAWLLSGRPGLPAEGWMLAAISAVIEIGYFTFLSAAYLRGDLSVVYPLARGTAPLLTVPVGLLILGERLSTVELLGVGLMLAGIWAVRRPVTAGPAVLPAVLTGVSIATYSSIDRVGVRLGPPWLYGWALGAMTAVLLAVWVWLGGWQGIRQRATGTRSPSDAPAPELDWPRAMLVGVLMLLSWLLVLFAYSQAPLTIVSPLRESAIVLVTGWGIWRLKEREGALVRLSGASVIVVGAALITVH
jgi:drug/metabolite transporter (DMT)-like permease